MALSTEVIKEVITENDLVPKDQLLDLEKQANEKKVPLERYLIVKKAINEDQLATSLAKKYKVDTVDLKEEKIDQAVLSLIPEPIARRHRVVAFKKKGKELFVAMLDPDDLQTREFIKKKTDFEVVPFLPTFSGFDFALSKYHTSLKTEFENIMKDRKDGFFDKEEDIWSQEYWDEWYASLDQHYIHLSRSHLDHTEVGAPPIKTKHGWLVFYSYAYNYYSPIPVAFTTEVALLDLKNPKKVIARSEKPLLFVRDSYERFGKVPNINFPSGAFVKGQKIYLYYGAADTVCAVAMGNLEDLIEDLDHSRIHLLGLERFEGNPILQPNMANTWEQQAVFNAAVLYDKKKIHLVYRAMSNDNTSVMGYASTTDGFNIEERLGYPIYTPREDFEGKGVPGGNSGCEDHRLTKIGDTVYMTYTAFNGKDSPRVALTSILYKDFVNKNWNWKKPVLISPPGMDDKDAAIFPQKINGKYAILHRLGQSVWIDYVDSLDFKEGQYIKGKILMDPRSGPRDSRKIGIAGPPIKTKHGWLLIYHGVSKKSDSHYHLRAALLDLKNPEKVLVRTKYAIFETETSYEKYGVVPNVVFSDGAIVKDGKLFVYYGAADKVIGVATMELDDLLRRLSEEGKRG